jgi:VCBS repeat-containing protein
VGNTDTATVTITITPVNDNNPAADPESFTVAEGGTATEADLNAGTSLLDGDTDIDLPSDSLTVNTTPVAGPSHGSLTLNANGTFSYTHSGSENFTDSFTYQVRDAVGSTGTATVTITITPVNDNNPVADPESFTVAEGGTATEADLDAGTSLLDGDTDIDLPGDSLSVTTTPVAGPSHGSLTLNANGTFSYTHNGSENFTDSFTYEVTDALGRSAVATVTITITPVNESPTVALVNQTSRLSENTDTSARIKVADIVISDDATGTNALSLLGADAALFEIVGTELYLKAGASLDFETQPALNVIVAVNDATLPPAPNDTEAMSIGLTDVNEAPGVLLLNPKTTLPQEANTSSPIKVAEIVIVDDALGSNDLSLSGADAALFEIHGTGLYLRAGVSLNSDAISELDVTVVVSDSSVGGGFSDRADMRIAIQSHRLSLESSHLNTVGVEESAADTSPTESETAAASEESAQETAAEEETTDEGLPGVPQHSTPQNPLYRLDGTRSLRSISMPLSRSLALSDVSGLDMDDTTDNPSRFAFSRGKQGSSNLTFAAYTRQARAYGLGSANAYLNLIHSLDAVKDEVAGEMNLKETYLGSAIVMSTGLSIGYVVWLLRGGMLLSSLLSSLPAWQLLDPLPVLAHKKGGAEADDDESLESILRKKPLHSAQDTHTSGSSARAESGKRWHKLSSNKSFSIGKVFPNP